MATEPLNALVLRAMADSASSQRKRDGDPGFMVTTFDREKGWSTWFEPKTPPPAEAEAVMTPVDTKEVARAERPVVRSVTILAGKMTTPEELAEEYDAVFWSEAAVEKFVLPYYASKSKWMAAHLLTTLSEVFYGYVPGPTPANTILPPPEAAPLEAQETPADTTGPSANAGIPFALAHLPRSDYVGLEDVATVGADLGVLLVKDGAVVFRRLSDYL
jgi:hypothetical protein